MNFRCIWSKSQTNKNLTLAQPKFTELTRLAGLICCLTWELPWCPRAWACPKTLVWVVLGLSSSLQHAEIQGLIEQNGLIRKFQRALPHTYIHTLCVCLSCCWQEALIFTPPRWAIICLVEWILDPGAYNWSVQELHWEASPKTSAGSVPLCHYKLIILFTIGICM